MKKLNRKGFTLIELLAVIVIMGILMMVAIPAMTRYINNSRKDTFKSTVQEYVNAVRNANASDSLSCAEGTGDKYVKVNSGILESGGKSPFNKRDLDVAVLISTDSTTGKTTYKVSASDGVNGIATFVESDKLERGNVGKAAQTATPPTGSIECTVPTE